jgi:superfamily II DNA or RNA helicase
MLLNAITDSLLTTTFGGSTFELARLTLRQHRVEITQSILRRSGHYVIMGVVKAIKHYYVHVEIRGSEDKIAIHGVCTCSKSTNCEHIVAVLLKAAEKVAPKVIRDPSVDAWLAALKNSLSNKARALEPTQEGCSIRYVLIVDPSKPTEVFVQLCLARHLKSGELIPKKSDSLLTQSPYMTPLDKELCTALTVERNLAKIPAFDDSYPLQGERGERLLVDLIATGRCHWHSVDHPALIHTATQKAVPTWHIDNEGFQQLFFEVDHHDDFIFALEHLWYLDEHRWAIGALTTGLDNKTAKLVLASPRVPPEAASEVADFLKKHEQAAPISRPKIFKQAITEAPEPIPCLHLFKASLLMPASAKNNWQQTLTEQPLADLSFDYQGIRVPWDNKQKIVSEIKDEVLTRIVRNFRAESLVVDALEDYELDPICDKYELSRLNPDYSQFFIIDPVAVDPLFFTAHDVPYLRADGWRIDFSEDYPYQIVDEPIEDWYSSVEEQAGYDWFGLELGITLKGQKINLLPVLQKLLPKLKAMSEREIRDNEPIYAALPDGRYIQLPSERIHAILNVLLELYDGKSLTEDEQLRLSKLHAGRLLELEKACGATELRWLGGENIRNLAHKLTNFKGITTAIVPPEFRGELRHYQLEGLSWLQFLREYELGGILADDMGLGKTIQALAHISLEKASGRMQTPTLVVAPTSLMFNWRMEAERFAPDLNVLVLHGAGRKQYFESIAQQDLVLTTYPLLARDKDILLRHQFHLLILDEAQYIKNAKNLATQIALQLKAKHRLCMTGTPMENHLGELWSLCHFLMPGLLGEQKKFNSLFRSPIEKHGDAERREHLQKRIAPFLLRRTKDNVATELPDKVEMIRQVELEDSQRDLYETIRVTMEKKVRDEIAKLGLARSHIIILDALLKLRQVCCDPRLLKIASAQQKKAKSAKLELLMMLIPELLEEGRRIILFSQFTEMLALIEEELHQRNIKYVKLTGQTKNRELAVQQFQEKQVPLFLISLKAGGTGLNLTAADTVIHYDPWWNPAVENQATDRAHRIGQEKTVFVYKLVVRGTVEEKILQMQAHKHALMEGLFSDKTTEKLKLSPDDLQTLFEPLPVM